MPKTPEHMIAVRPNRQLTPEEREYFRRAGEEEESDPEVLADAERCWARDCRVPLAHLRSEGVFDIIAAVAALKEAREAKGMTLDEVSAASGIGVETLAAAEAGENKAPSPRTLQRYAKALGLRFVTELVLAE